MAQMWLNDYRVEGVLGRGGMGTVLRARDSRTDGAVALKLLTSRSSTKPDFVDAFHREIRAVAQLDHPNIAAIVDTGIVTDFSSDFIVPLETGTLFYAMELVETGTLADLDEPLEWPAIWQLFTDILAALAHAHARGVIHRDLKPANILIARRGDHLVPKITDFGLADLLHQAADSEPAGRLTRERKILGTPRYMAPEQILGHWRDQGPWTDLYAAGCIAYHLIAGHPVYSGEPAEVLRAHLEAAVPRISVDLCLPEVQAWLDSLLQKSPQQRAQHAADASAALAELANAQMGSRPVSRDDVATDADTWPLDHDPRTPYPIPGERAPNQLARPRLPADWRPRDTVAGATNAPTLYHLRPPRFVCREAERDQLWKILGETLEGNTPRCVVLRGPAGTGKTRLAVWLGRRAGELGAVQAFAGTHTTGDAWSGVRTIVVNALRIEGLPPERALARAREWYAQRTTVDASTFFHCATLVDLALRRSERSAEEVFDTLAHFFTLVAADRPLLLGLDDVHASTIALRLTERILELEAPILVVCTAQTESLARHPREAGRLELLEEGERTSTLQLAPFERAEQRQLVQQMLDLDTALSHQIVERSSGNPLFAVQLVGHCIDRGVLLPGPKGYRLADDNEVVLPDHVRDAWEARLEECLAALDGDPRHGREALEVAATLGQSVELKEWFEALQILQIPLHRELLHECVSRGLLLPVAGGWAFAHALFRGALLDRSRSSGRWPAQNIACARALTQLSVGQSDEALRIARHLVVGEAAAEALPRLLHAGNAAWMRVDIGEFEEVTELLAQCVAEAGPRRNDAVALRTAFRAIHVLLFEGTRAAHPIAVEAMDLLCDDTDANVGSFLYRVRAIVELHGGDPAIAQSLAREAVAYANASGLPSLRPENLRLLALTLLYGGRVQEAAQTAERLVELTRELGTPEERLKSLLCLSQAATQIGSFERALEACRQAYEIARGIGSRAYVFDALRYKAAPHRLLGQYEAAMRCWHESLEIVEDPARLLYSWWEAELALIASAQGDDVEAERWLEEFFVHDRNQVMNEFVAASLELARIQAARGVWDRWDELVASCDAYLDSGRACRDAAMAADRAAALAQATGESARAATVRALAKRQWDLLETPA